MHTERLPSHALARVTSAAALSNLGDGIRLVALPLLATRLTDRPILVSGVVVASYVPWVLLGLPIGTIVDRGRPDVFMRSANVGRAVVLGLLTGLLASGSASLGALYVAALALGVGEAFYDNAAQSLVPRLVPDSRLEAANSALITAERVGQDLAGPAVAGVLFAASVWLPFGLNAAASIAAVLLLLGVRTTKPQADQAVPTDSAIRAIAAETLAGMRWLWRNVAVRTLILTGAALTFCTMFWESTLVLFALRTIGLSDGDYGVILAIGAVGGVLGAMATPALIRRFSGRSMQVLGLAMCAGVDLALAIVPSAATAALAWGGTGFGFALWNVVSISLRQRLVPSPILARVNSAARTISISAVPLGAIAGGACAGAFGLRSPIILSTVLLVGLAVAFAFRADPPRAIQDTGEVKKAAHHA